MAEGLKRAKAAAEATQVKEQIKAADAAPKVAAADTTPDLEKLKTAKIPTRRVKMLMVNPTDFMYLFTEGLVWRKRTELIEGVPADSKLIAVAADSVRNGIMLVVQSKEYDEVPINVLPPVQVVSIQTINGSTKKKAAPRKKR